MPSVRSPSILELLYAWSYRRKGCKQIWVDRRTPWWPFSSIISTYCTSAECIGSILQGEDYEPWSPFLHRNVTPIFTPTRGRPFSEYMHDKEEGNGIKERLFSVLFGDRYWYKTVLWMAILQLPCLSPLLSNCCHDAEGHRAPSHDSWMIMYILN